MPYFFNGVSDTVYDINAFKFYPGETLPGKKDAFGLDFNDIAWQWQGEEKDEGWVEYVENDKERMRYVHATLMEQEGMMEKFEEYMRAGGFIPATPEQAFEYMNKWEERAERERGAAAGAPGGQGGGAGVEGGAAGGPAGEVEVGPQDVGQAPLVVDQAPPVLDLTGLTSESDDSDFEMLG